MLCLSKIVCFRELGFFTWYVDQKAAVFVREQEAMDQENMNGKRTDISDISIGYQGLCPKRYFAEHHHPCIHHVVPFYLCRESSYMFSKPRKLLSRNVVV